MVLMVNYDLPVKTVQEFVQYAKKQGGRLNYASSGNGNVTHLAGFPFNKGVGISAEHVPYKGTAPALVDLVGGQRSEEHTSELQSLMRISYAVFCLKKKHSMRSTNKYIQHI